MTNDFWREIRFLMHKSTHRALKTFYLSVSTLIASVGTSMTKLNNGILAISM